MNTLQKDIIVAISNILSRKKGLRYADISDIYQEVARIRNVKVSRELELEITNQLQRHCSQTKYYLGEEDLFEIKSANSTLWKNKISGEKDLKVFVFDLLRQFPGLNATTLSTHILELFQERLKEADKILSTTRPGEMKIEQIIRNFVSHKDSYKDEIDFITDSHGVTRMYLKENQLHGKKQSKPISDRNVEEILTNEDEVPEVPKSESALKMSTEVPHKKKRNVKSNTYIRKKDFSSYLEEYEKKLTNGYTSEGLVYQYEQERLKNLGREDLAKRVKWISRDNGDGYGYDIKSFDIDKKGKAKTLYIEVKGTSSSLNTSFEMSRKEYKFAKKHMRKHDYKIYRIGKEKGENKGYIIDHFEGLFKVEPSQYLISLKDNVNK